MTINKQQWITVGVAAAVCVIVMVVVALVVRNVLVAGRVRTDVVDQRQAAERSIEAGTTACSSEQHPDTCRLQVVTREAERLQTAELCRALEDTAYADCVIEVARGKRDEASCRILDGDARDRCEDVVWEATAEAMQDQSFCDRLHNASWQDRCKQKVLALIVQSGDCVAGEVDPALCETEAIVQDAVSRLDTDRCFSLDNDEQVDACVRAVEEAMSGAEGEEATKVDTDADGLSDADEARYGSDPLRSDTDGDGYPDGEEVANGYSPTGPGRL